MTFPAYPEYKDSGVEWIGEVPGHWSITQTKRLFHIVNGSTPTSNNDSFWDGDIAWITPADLSQLPSLEIFDSGRRITAEGLASCGTTMVPKKSIVLSTRAPIGSLGISDVELCTNQGCKSLIAAHRLEPKFYAYMFSIASSELNIRGKGSTFLELSGDALAAFELVDMPCQEQSTIAAFLDHETAKIDALIAEQEKLIELLKEKRQAVISHAVTKGLDPNVPMKDSGVEWLGEVPEHWNIAPLKYAIRTLEQGWSPQCENYPAEGLEEWGVLKVGCVNGGNFNPHENKALPNELEPQPNLGLLAGDVLISRANTKELVGSAAVVDTDRPNLLLCDKLYRLRTRANQLLPAYFSMLLGTREARSVIELSATGASSSMQNIGQGTILGLKIPLPLIREQESIIHSVRKQCAPLENLLAESQHAINFLKERRSALISAAVTGKIDVRGFTPVSEAV